MVQNFGGLTYESALCVCVRVCVASPGFTYDRSIGEFVLTHPDIQIPKRGKIYSMNEANRWNWDKPLQEYVTALQTAQCETKSQYSSRYIGSMVGDVHRTLLYGGIFGAARPPLHRLCLRSHPCSRLSCHARPLRLPFEHRQLPAMPSTSVQRFQWQIQSSVLRSLTGGDDFLCAGYPADTKNVNGKLRLLYEAAPMSFLIEQVPVPAVGMLPLCNMLPRPAPRLGPDRFARRNP